MLRKSFSFLLSIFLIALGFGIVGDFCHHRTHGFALQKIISKEKKISAENLLSSEDLSSIQKILNQPFTFQNKGQQCYVFASEDDKYILKFLRWNKIEPPFWAKYLPGKWKEKIEREKAEKKGLDFASYKLAFNALKEETGLVYLHLEKTNFLKTSLCLYDAIKVRYDIPADEVEFILQKKADLFPPFLEKNKEHLEELKPFFTKLAVVLAQRYEKGIQDSDISLEYNMGISEKAPILFDIGNLKTIEEPVSKKDFLEKESLLIKAYLERNYPQLALYFQEILEKEALL